MIERLMHLDRGQDTKRNRYQSDRTKAKDASLIVAGNLSMITSYAGLWRMKE
jgi:hypothetical protein